jgi:hypoxanthine phosphoribosyltransferase
MPDLSPVLSKEDIQKTVVVLAQKISNDYHGRDVVIVGVLKGAFIFLADLIRHLTIPVQVDFIRLASYGCQTETSGSICLTKELEIDIADRDVLVVEDIIDTGHSLAFLLEHLKLKKPKSVRLCTLIDKPERRESQIAVDYAGFIVKHGFLVGYGLDFAENYRHLPAIYHLQD